jgi:hypothetical protein
MHIGMCDSNSSDQYGSGDFKTTLSGMPEPPLQTHQKPKQAPVYFLTINPFVLMKHANVK